MITPLARRSPAPAVLAALAACTAAATFCWQAAPATSAVAPAPQQAATRIQFSDATQAAGIRFRHNSGAFGRKYLPETMGSGVAVFDADGDGRQDILFVQSMDWPGRPKRAASIPALYRNNGNGTFTDITRTAGLAVEMYGLGAAVADFDNDGDADVYLTAFGPNRLFRNRGGGRFEDVTKGAGVGDPGFSSSALWFDYDRDGRLDLFVGNYVEWSREKDLFCTLDGQAKSYCTPESYKGQSPTLYRNRGDGTFEDVTRKAGLYDASNKMLGVALIDYDDDGHLDVFAANDTQPNRLFRNNGAGTFADVAVTAGVAFDESGVARAGMGVDAADYDGSGRQGLIIGNFSNQMMALYANEGKGLFIDEAPRSALGQASLLTLTFGCFFFDADLDGWPDIFAANGHVADDIERVQRQVAYAQRPHLFRNTSSGRFAEVTAQAGAALGRPMVARGAAYGDYDGDGDLDVFVTTNNGPARLLRNDSAGAGHLLRLQLTGRRSNRDGIGARVTVSAGGRELRQMVKTGSSYLSQSELPLTFGLGAAAAADRIQIRWPGGHVDTLGRIAANQMIVVEEGRGLVTAGPLRGKTR